MKERRAGCPVCHQEKAVTARGVMRQHLGLLPFSGSRSRDICEGTGVAPEPGAFVDGPARSLDTPPLEFPGTDWAFLLPGGGWQVSDMGPEVKVPVFHDSCQSQADASPWYTCTRDSWPHDWHIAAGTAQCTGSDPFTTVLAVWPATEEEKEAWKKMMLSAHILVS